MNNFDVIVIGAGASGMAAAARAGECGAKVLLLERMRRPGLKLLISGKGRSNVTNAEDDMEGFISHYKRNGLFLINAFHRFFNDDLIGLLKRLGVETVVERGKRVFPKLQRAAAVVGGLMKYLKENNASLLCEKRVREVLVEQAPLETLFLTGQGEARGVICTDGAQYFARKVILATGGLSYPRTGSSGDGYEIAKKLGHVIVPLTAALVPLETKEKYVKELMGLALENVKVTVFCNGKKMADEFGDTLFTHFGVSGPVVLKLSGVIVESLRRGDVTLSIDLKPALDFEKLDKRLLRELEKGKRQFKNVMSELLPRKLIPVFVNLTGVPQDKLASQVTLNERRRAAELLKDFRLTIVRPRPIEEAIVTRGGVSTKEIDPRTMESKLIRGLYFCGEIIDVDGETGGFNLQAAFSTGYVAGESAARQNT